jgi:hypothetical protein
MYACNMHRISVRPPSPSASGRRNRSKRQGRRASTARPDGSPCATASAASWRLKEWSPRMGTAVPTPLGEAGMQSRSSSRKQRGGTVEQEKEQHEVTVGGGAGRKAGAVDATDDRVGAGRVTVNARSGAGLSSPPHFLIQPAHWKRRTRIS